MKSYEDSTATLRAVLAHPLLQREKIEETMDAMASANADAQDIQDTIRIGTDIAQGEAGIDDAELEDELNKMIKGLVAVGEEWKNGTVSVAFSRVFLASRGISLLRKRTTRISTPLTSAD